MKYLLDTDTFSRSQAGKGSVYQHMLQVGNENVATTVVTEIEALRGRHAYVLKASDGSQLLHAQVLLRITRKALVDTKVIDIDELVAAEFDKLREVKSLKKIGRADLLIGCIALRHQATLVTRNVKHFRQIPGLKIENWID